MDEVDDKADEHVEEFRATSGNLMDSKTSHLDDLLNEKLERAFYEDNSMVNLHNLAKIASEHGAIDLAFAASRLPHDARRSLFENLPETRDKIDFLISTDSTTRVVIFRHIPDDDLADLLEQTPPDEAVEMLDDLSIRRLSRVLESMEPEKAEHIRDLQRHGRNTAGRLMTNEYFSFAMNATIGEVAKQIRENPGIDLTRRIFVLNENDELQGFVPSRNLIISPPNTPLKQVMHTIAHTIRPEATRDEVVDLVERYKIPALPVVNDDNILQGIITYEDVVEAIEDIADETLARMAGTAEDVGELEPTITRILARAPWLLFTLFAGLANISAIAYAERVQGAWITSLLFVVPLITAMSGNVGLQCSTILVRGMATGLLSSGTKVDAVTKEIIIGLCTGVIFGTLAGIIVYTFSIVGITENGPGYVATASIVSLGILGACLTATFLGVFSPLFFARIGIDPAVASGPIITAFNDLLSTVMYILIAYWVSSTIF
ncbi:Magnesium transporter MgtE [Chlamydiales bacterium SCGC AG-110-M15]|nr:Magnesium transporter MgtE [Chlamydiales bacterium SCGC AG-110-M15]